jgi:hypothetical protein
MVNWRESYYYIIIQYIVISDNLLFWPIIDTMTINVNVTIGSIDYIDSEAIILNTDGVLFSNDGV